MSDYEKIDCPKCGGKKYFSLKPNGYGHCWSTNCCHKQYPDQGSEGNHAKFEHVEGICVELAKRRISKKICEKYGYELGIHYNQHVHIMNYRNSTGQLIAQKFRNKDKQFSWIGDAGKAGFFGQHLFNPNKKIGLTITEGEIDALSVAEAFQGEWPVVSIKDGISSALKAIKENLEYVLGFSHVNLCFDNDGSADEAIKECAELLPPGFCRIVKLPHKDANEMLKEDKMKELIKCIYSAKEFRPDGIEDFGEIEIKDIEEIVNVGAELPYPILNDKIRGLKNKYLYTLVAREKCGKTTVTKEIALHLMKNNHKVGLLYLEESAAEARISVLAMEKGIPMWQVIENLDLLGGPEKIQEDLADYKNRGMYIYNHKGAFSPETLLKRLHFMALGLGCEFIILDNISISIGGDTNVNERKKIDQVVTDCNKIIQNTGVTILNVVHVVKNRGKDENGNDIETITREDIHGSGAFAKFSHVVLGLERDSDRENVVKLKVLANRVTGKSGYADTLRYNEQTGRLEIAPREIEI